jgi:hypothetical protein
VKKKQKGQDPLNLGKTLTIALFKDDMSIVEKVAKRRGHSKGSVIRELVREAIANKFHEV